MPSITTLLNNSGAITKSGTASSANPYSGPTTWNWAYTESTGRTFVDTNLNGTYEYAFNSSGDFYNTSTGQFESASEDEMEIWAGVTSSPDYPTSDEEEPIDTSKQ